MEIDKGLYTMLSVNRIRIDDRLLYVRTMNGKGVLSDSDQLLGITGRCSHCNLVKCAKAALDDL